MSIVSVDNIQPIGSGTTVTVNKSVTLESGNTNITGVCTATSFVGNLTGTASQVTIANGANNRILTAASSNTINAESNVLYDGTNFGIGKSPSRALDVQGKIRSSDSVCFGDNSSTPSEGSAIHRPAASALAFVTNNAERVRIDSSGRIGIGENNPTRDVVLKTSGSVQFSMVGATNQSVYLNFGDTDDDNIGGVYYDNTNNRMIIRANTNDAVQVKSNGNMAVNDGDLEIGNYRNGISFAATSNANGSNVSELFSDYEAGSWTPQLLDGNGSNYPVSKDANQTVYRRIGDMVYVFYNINRTENGSKTGILYMPNSCLPYSVTYGIAASGQFWVDHSSPSAGLGDIVGGHHNVGTSGIYWVKPTDKSGIGQASTRYLEHGQWSYGRWIYGSFCYRTS